MLVANDRLPLRLPGNLSLNQCTGAFSAKAKKKAMNIRNKACEAFLTASKSTIVDTVSNASLTNVCVETVSEISCFLSLLFKPNMSSIIYNLCRLSNA